MKKVILVTIGLFVSLSVFAETVAQGAGSSVKNLKASRPVERPSTIESHLVLLKETRSHKAQVFDLGQHKPSVRISIDDWQGEPVNRDVIVKIELRCPGANSFRTLQLKQTCAFEGLEYHQENDTLLLRYQEAQFNQEDGVVNCVRRRPQKIPLKCPQ